ncbi:MAG: hypothetical protein E6K13_00375 [Methanobacteriota archaeon]|nr:MAG: hypothetical protein E6K13_00375 [Euryarchaeota archaeon]
MRSVSIVLALAMVMALALVILPSPTRALDPPKLSITIEAGVGRDLRFNPATIVLPSVPIILNVTLVNNQTGPGQQNTQHTFSIRDSSKAKHIEIWVNTTRARASVEFAVNSTTQMSVRGVLFTAETALAGGFLFFCSPHEAVGMVGNIVIGGVAQRPSPEIGVFLRAYWIGIISPRGRSCSRS